MIGWTLRRIGQGAIVVWIVLTICFALLHLAPGEPIQLLENPRLSDEARARLERVWGLDRPLPEQYVTWLGATVRGDLGVSLSRSTPVTRVLAERLPPTLLLMGTAFVVEILLGLGLGLAAAVGPPRLDAALRGVALGFWSVPVFLLALAAIELLTVRFRVMPGPGGLADDADLLGRVVLPALVLGLARAAALFRFTRTGLLEVLSRDFVLAARARGLSPRQVLLGHALPAAAGPIVHRIGLGLPHLVGGSLIVEVVFGWPGLGRGAWMAAHERDLPVVLATTALAAVVVVVGNLLADLAHASLDRRVAEGFAGG